MTVLAVPPKPSHHYVAIVRGYFAYASALSDADRANGLASKPLTLVGYQGRRGSEYTFSVSDGGPYAELVTCNEPCDVAQSLGMGGSKVYQVQPGSILGDLIEDARNGLLDSPAPAPQTPAVPPTGQLPVAVAPDGMQEAIQEIVRQGLPDPSGWSEAQLNEQFRCPEALTTDDQRKASVAETIVWYGKHRKPVTVDGVMEFRRGLLVSHNCTQSLANLARPGR